MKVVTVFLFLLSFPFRLTKAGFMGLGASVGQVTATPVPVPVPVSVSASETVAQGVGVGEGVGGVVSSIKAAWGMLWASGGPTTPNATAASAKASAPDATPGPQWPGPAATLVDVVDPVTIFFLRVLCYVLLLLLIVMTVKRILDVMKGFMSTVLVATCFLVLFVAIVVPYFPTLVSGVCTHPLSSALPLGVRVALQYVCPQG